MRQTVEYPSSFGGEYLLLREYSHRINNEFASLISIISVAASRAMTDDAKNVLALVRDQLNNYANVHHALQIPELGVQIDAAAYVCELCKAIRKARLNDNGIQLILSERTFKMDSERCWRLGLIVSELVGNAARHAFGRRGGIIRVELVPSTSFVQCRIRDNGKSESTARPGNGLRIVDALAGSLGGRFVQHFGPRGTRSVLTFPQDRELGRIAPTPKRSNSTRSKLRTKR
jgi:two-component sensor histidine kinase